jgi:glyoxylase-like metal-dependent hydrolase (beta-lactamase superfamily II)
VTYVIGDAAFIGDTMFAPDGGSARCDFPGGSSKKLYASIQRIYSLPAETRIFLCHDYPPATRQATAETSIAAERAGNTHVKAGVTEADFMAMRRCARCEARATATDPAGGPGQHPRRPAARA